MKPTDQPADMGMNRTGVAMSPMHSKKMEEASGKVVPPPGDEEKMAEVREGYQAQATPVGTMPPPKDLKGAAKAAGKALKGEKANVLLDKIGERMAFERAGVRLYDALISKLRGSGMDYSGVGLTEEALSEIRADELRHMLLLSDALEEMGGDPTTVTPCADVAGVEAEGVVQVLTDPRTTLNQGLGAILAAELVDNASWEMLVDLTRNLGNEDMAQRFEQALNEEVEHLRKVRGWAEALVMAEATGQAVP